MGERLGLGVLGLVLLGNLDEVAASLARGDKALLWLVLAVFVMMRIQRWRVRRMELAADEILVDERRTSVRARNERRQYDSRDVERVEWRPDEFEIRLKGGGSWLVMNARGPAREDVEALFSALGLVCINRTRERLVMRRVSG